MNVTSRPGHGILSPAAERDESLVAAVASGQEDALEQLMRRHRRGVSSVVHRIVRSPADAEEVVQDVFLLVWKHAARFRGDAKVTTWMYSIARNAAVSRLRQDRGAPPTDLLLLRDAGFQMSQRPDPEREAIASELARHLVSSIAKLSAVHRAVLVGMVRYSSAAKLGRHHDIVIGTVKSRLHRARRALRAALLAA